MSAEPVPAEYVSITDDGREVVSFRFPCAAWSVALILDALGYAPGALAALERTDGGRDLGFTRNAMMDPWTWVEYFADLYGWMPGDLYLLVEPRLLHFPNHFAVELSEDIVRGMRENSLAIPTWAMHTFRVLGRGW